MSKTKFKIAGFDGLDEDFKTKMLQSVYAIEGDSGAVQMLWQLCHNKDAFQSKNVTSWEEHLRGGMVQIGVFGDMPVCIEFHFTDINGQTIMFYNCCSMVTHSGMVDAWFEKFLPNLKTTDMMNYHNAFHAIRAANEQKQGA